MMLNFGHTDRFRTIKLLSTCSLGELTIQETQAGIFEYLDDKINAKKFKETNSVE